MNNPKEFIVFFKQSQQGHEVKKPDYVSTSLRLHKYTLTLPLWEATYVRGLHNFHIQGHAFFLDTLVLIRYLE